MAFYWQVGSGPQKTFDMQPYGENEFDIWGNEISAPDGSLYTYGPGLIKVKFKQLWVRNELAKSPGYGFQELQNDWHSVQNLTELADRGKIIFSVWSPKDNSYAVVTAVPRWPDPSGRFYGPWLREFELFIDAPNIPVGYTQGPITIPALEAEPPLFTPQGIESGFGVGTFGAGPFGVGETIY